MATVLGYNTVGGSLSTTPGGWGRWIGTAFTASVTGKMTSMSAYMQYRSGSSTVIYKVHKLVGATFQYVGGGSKSISGTSWQTITGLNIPIEAGEKYLLSVGNPYTTAAFYTWTDGSGVSPSFDLYYNYGSTTTGAPDYDHGPYSGSANSIYGLVDPAPPTVSTASFTDILKDSATLNGNITSIGTYTPTVRGFYLKQGTGTPTSSDTVIQETGSFSTGAYSLGATGLLPLTQYSVVSFATNSVGTATSGTTSFTTLEAPASGSHKQNISNSISI